MGMCGCAWAEMEAPIHNYLSLYTSSQGRAKCNGGVNMSKMKAWCGHPACGILKVAFLPSLPFWPLPESSRRVRSPGLQALLHANPE